MSQLADALKFTHDLTVRSNGAEKLVAVVKLPDEPAGVYGLIKADGTFERVTAERPGVSHTLASTDQIVPVVEDAITRLGATENVSVWYSAAAVVALFEHDSLQADLRTRATVPLRHSPEFAVLQKEASSETWRSPKEFVSFVRTKLPDAINDSEGFLSLIKSLRAHYSESRAQKTSLGRESLGSEVDAGVVSELGDLPDIVRFHVRVFDDPAILRTQPIRCVLECNPRTVEFRIVPVAADLTTAINTEMQALGELLKAVLACPVFYGTP